MQGEVKFRGKARNVLNSRRSASPPKTDDGTTSGGSFLRLDRVGSRGLSVARAVGLLSVFFLVLALAAVLSTGAAAAQSAPDCGTISHDLNVEGNYTITNLDELQCVGNSTNTTMSDDFVLTTDIDASGTSSWNGDKGLDPIGADFNTPFTGSFDGNRYTISNLKIDRPNENYVGLFGYANSSAEIANLRLEDVNVTASEKVGGLVGKNNGGMVVESTASGMVNGSTQVGGLVGNNDDGGTVAESTASGTVNGSTQVGGLSGYNYGRMTNVTASVAVGGTAEIGGVVGFAEVASIKKAMATGDVTGETEVGGAVGMAEHVVSEPLENITATGFVDGTTNVGGLVGKAGGRSGSNVVESTATGNVTGNGSVGGLVGNQAGIIHKSTASGTVSGKVNVGALVGVQSGQVQDSTSSGAVTGSSSVGGLTGLAVGQV